MKSRASIRILAIALFVLVLPVELSAQQPRYKIVDIPTLGGPAAAGNVDCTACAQFINDPGVVVGGSSTAIPDPSCAGCVVNHAFRWQNGVVTDLGALPGINGSHATSINARGWATGGSSTSASIDPLTGNPAEHAVLWKWNEIVDLGTLDHGVNSAGLYVNNAGEVVGFAAVDTTIDPFPNPNSPWSSPIHAFISRDGVMRDLGTLGGLDSSPMAGCNNQRVDSVSGWSTTDSTLNPTTGLPTEHAFLWRNGAMIDIPTLGGTFAQGQCANNQGQVIGQSNLTEDSGCDGSVIDGSCLQHAFLWDHGSLKDLGTLAGPGGVFSQALWLNDAGEAVGGSVTADGFFHATLWKNRQITDLGTLDGDCFSVANAINSSGQIVGQSFSCDFTVIRAVVWINGTILDLNAAIPPTATLELVETDNINDRGEIVGRGLPPSCDNPDLCGHVFLLIPCDAAGAQSCQSDEGRSDQASPASVKMNATTPDPQKTREFVARLRAQLAQRYHIGSFGAPKK